MIRSQKTDQEEAPQLQTMFSDLKFLVAVARYFSVCFKRRFIVHKSSYDVVGRPFENLITHYEQPIVHGYDLATELNDASQLQVQSMQAQCIFTIKLLSYLYVQPQRESVIDTATTISQTSS